ncbi:MAG: orotidine-5'-phosphate decarboxylase [Marinilabiliales bacterium]|nr:orotidine-5'-phosphate decarboxylase [Marinilabiliales bacterium]
MDKAELFSQIRAKQSFLCVGLDTDIQKIPSFLKDTSDPLFYFNKQIIDATAPFAVAYKPNLAFYESRGTSGWNSLSKTVHYLRENYPEIFLIADAKRGDIGNTSSMYARTFFEEMDFDAVTVAPYMGEDSVTPFLAYLGKWVILLALTSNKGAFDFQYLTDQEGNKLFEKVLHKSQQWADDRQMMYVVGATKAEELGGIRKIIPNHFLLVPGVGAQGGSLQEVARHGLNEECGLLVNSSRAILYASTGSDFAEMAGKVAMETQREMSLLLKERSLI